MRKKFLAVLAAVFGVASAAIAATVGGDAPAPKTYFEQGILTRSGEVVEALGPNLMGDAINEYSGGLEFTHTDVTLPGNNTLPVALGRRFVAGSPQTYGDGHFGNWELEIPRLHSVTTQTEPSWYGGNDKTNYNRCSQFSEPPITTISTSQGTASYGSSSFWDGYHLYVPGAGDQTLLSRAAENPIYPSDGTAASYPVVTKNHWQLSCLPRLDNGPGEGFLARSPDGTSYRFDHIASRAWPQVKVSYLLQARAGTGSGSWSGTAFIQRAQIWLLPTLVTDRFGNWVRYTYGGTDGSRVSSITSSDGRSISFSYSGDRIQSATDGTRTWSYGYNAAGRLQTVTQPDASTWTFALDQLFVDASPYSAGDPQCDYDADWSGKPPTSGTLTHPSGAVGTFVLNLTTHGRSSVPGTACHPLNKVGSYFAAWSMTSKTLSGPGMPAMTWNYAYSAASGSFAPCNGCANTKAVTITDPLNNVTVNTYGTQYGLNEGLLLSGVEGVAGGSSLRSTSYSYNPSDAGPYPSRIGSTRVPADSMSGIQTPQNQRAISQQGVTFTLTVTAFDGYARPTSVAKSSSLGYSRSEATAYYDHTGLWVLGQTAAQTIAGVQASATSYDPATALPTASWKFGKPQATYGFNTGGTLASITDGLGHSTSFSSYMRGLPQRIDYADGSQVAGVVHNIGVLASTTNEAGTTWNYTYDPMGRLASKTPPGGDPVAYNPTTLSFVQSGAPAYGLEAGHWRQTITTGNAVTAHYFDARWRKRVTVTYDANNPGATQRMQRFDYDPYNRTTFAAYPARSIGSISDAVPGTATSYDALGRPTLTLADSELGALSTNTQYLANFQKKVTNPRGFATTIAYQAFDEPTESTITSIASPEGVSVAIGRDIFGKPLSISRSGNGVSATRTYVYDGNQLLCKTIEPEIGATIQNLDAANNVSWRAIGLGLTGTGTCDQASVPGSKMIGYTYDARNRVTGTGFGDGSPSIGRSYTADGLPSTVVSNGSTWGYYYNNRRLLIQENLYFPGGGLWYVPRGYDANGHQSGLTYPDGTNVTFNPNALGEPTQVGAYATGVSYHPNGAVAGYTLGNGVVHTTTQNTRGLPYRNSDAGILQDRYEYDANGNIGAITDEQEGVSSRAMGYDGLDRLTAANSPGVWGNASYGYDALDNIRTSSVGSRSAVHSYNASNKLETITANGVTTGFVYDSQGNVIGRGGQGFYFDQGNRMQLANGKASYSYDGLGRRVMTYGLDGSTTYQMYSQDGRMLIRQPVGASTNNSFTLQIYLGGKTIAETNSASGTAYLYSDALGSPVAATRTLPAADTYGCPAGWSLAGATCSQGTTSTQPATIAGYTCPSGYTLSGSTCSLTTDSNSSATTNYNCPSGWTLSGTNCTETTSNPATPIYACPSGFTLSGSTCSGSSTTPATSRWDCKGQGSLQPLGFSPSGYYCFSRVISAQAYDACPDIAASYGLAYAGYRQNTKTTGTCYVGPVPAYSCPSGATLSGSNCIAPAAQPASVSGYTCSSGTLSGSNCLNTTTNAASVSYSCPSGQTLSGTTCHASSTSTVAGTPYYSCPAGYTPAGSSCTTQGTATMAATATYSCPSGTLSGASCLNALTRTRYEPYGNTAAGTVPNGIGFTGHVNDADTGLVYMQQRYYDPLAGRFLSVDPIVADANTGKGFNLYEYVSSNPYGSVDPDGRAEERLVDETHLGRGGAVAELGGGWAGAPARTIRAPADARAAGAADRAASTRAAEAAKAGEATSGTAGGERSGKPFTPAGKMEVKYDNATQNGGQTTCSNCGQATVPAKQSQSGVTPPGNETHVDHITPKSKGGDGAPSNGQVLCRDCNLKKRDK